ncbi:MAG: adenosylcobinamide amidohydrolase [Syntrophorhabdales bacterium]
MLLGIYYKGVEIHREEKIIYARFLMPHRVISTCPAAGGVRDDLDYLYNHQSCEPIGHDPAALRLIGPDPQGYRSMVCRQYRLPDDRCATLGTAANMRYAITKEARFRDLAVVAVCTGGAETNAGRAGDPAVVYECDGAYETVSIDPPVSHGTINTMLFISREMTPGAMVNAVMTATEAKAAALQELDVNSRYSHGIATGTGTDQIGVAARLETGIPLTSAGKHTVLGELIGKTVCGAVKATMALQDSLTPERQRSAVRHLERFGASHDSMRASVAARLGKGKGALLAANFTVIERDPLVVAAVAALVHVRDKVAWGILPGSCAPELWATYGAQISAAVSGIYDRLPVYRATLAAAGCTSSDRDILNLVEQAFALGFQDKWPEETREQE